MGLRDWFRRRPPAAPDWIGDLFVRVGRLEADVERLKSLELAWADYSDRLNRLVGKLNKRDQRAAAVAPETEEDAFMRGTRAVAAHFQRNGGSE